MGGSGTEVYSGFCCSIKSMDQRSLPGQASWPSWDLIPTQSPPGSSGISDSGDSSRNKCQDTGGTQRLLPLGGRWKWERLALASLNPTDSWSSSLFGLPEVPQLSAPWMTVPSALCPRRLTSLHWLLWPSWPKPFHRLSGERAVSSPRSRQATFTVSLLRRTRTQEEPKECQGKISIYSKSLKN